MSNESESKNSISDALEAIAALDNQKKLSENSEAWLEEMYGDDEETLNFIRQLNEKNSDDNLPKIISKQFVEFKDNKRNPVKVPSEDYIVSLEQRIDRLEEVCRIQKSELIFLKNKYLITQQQLKNVEAILNFFGDSE